MRLKASQWDECPCKRKHEGDDCSLNYVNIQYNAHLQTRVSDLLAP